MHRRFEQRLGITIHEMAQRVSDYADLLALDAVLDEIRARAIFDPSQLPQIRIVG
jgi:hypothetical protein